MSTKIQWIPGTPGVVKVKKISNSTELKKRLVKNFDTISMSYYPKEDQSRIKEIIQKKQMSGYEAQHIIPVQMKDHPVIKKIGMDMNHEQNGIFLPKPDGRMHSLSTHKGFHSIYNEVVGIYLDDIHSRLGENADVDDLSFEVYKLQLALRSSLRGSIPIYGRKNKAEKLEVGKRGGGATQEMWKRHLDRELEKISKLSRESLALKLQGLDAQQNETEKQIQREEREKMLKDAFSTLREDSVSEANTKNATNKVSKKEQSSNISQSVYMKSFLESKTLNSESKSKYSESYNNCYLTAKGQIVSTFKKYPELSAEELAAKMMRNYAIDNKIDKKLVNEVFRSLKFDVADLAEAYCHTVATKKFKLNVMSKEMYSSYGTKHVPSELAEYMRERSEYCEKQITNREKSAEKIKNDYKAASEKSKELEHLSKEKHNAQIIAQKLYETQKEVWSESESAAQSHDQSESESQGEGQYR